METANASKFHCPYCKGKRLQVATNTEFATSTQSTSKTVTTTVSTANTRYWVCQDCGSTFPFPQDLKAQADEKAKSAKELKDSLIPTVVVGVVCLALSNILIFGIIGVVFLLSAFWVHGWGVPSAQKEVEQLYAEYEDLLSKCTD